MDMASKKPDLRPIGLLSRFDRTDVDTHFHGGRAGEQVDIAFLELLLELPQSVWGLLGTVFLGPQIRRGERGLIVPVHPDATLAKARDFFVGLEPGCNFLLAIHRKRPCPW